MSKENLFYPKISELNCSLKTGWMKKLILQCNSLGRKFIGRRHVKNTRAITFFFEQEHFYAKHLFDYYAVTRKYFTNRFQTNSSILSQVFLLHNLKFRLEILRYWQSTCFPLQWSQANEIFHTLIFSNFNSCFYLFNVLFVPTN